jgi:predicted secreted protein
LCQTDHASHIVLSVGEEHVLALASLAMAGYKWSGSVSGADAGAVALVLRRGELPAGSNPGVSAPEEAVLRGVRPGRALVRLELRRPWERDQPAAQRVEVQIEVRPNGYRVRVACVDVP